MDKDTLQKDIATKEAQSDASLAVAPVAGKAPATGFAGKPPARGSFGGARGGRTGGGNRRPSAPRAKPEFDQKIIDIRRVTRVASGGRRFSFSVALVAGNRKGLVGIGLGKGADTAIAIDKATRNAKKNMIKVPLTKTGSIPFDVYEKFCSSEVTLTPAPGRGMVAGSSVRNVLELAGMKDVVAKIQTGSKNRLNNARAALAAIKKLVKLAPMVTRVK
ncbi:MAG: ribosomal protein small subunit ribosomal protein [Candidatus Parcubacteria bacterium]|jgi:small subunit ribosomal protein S5